MFYFGLFPGVCSLNANVSANSVQMERIECSEILALKLQTPGNNPKENIRHSKQGQSLRSRIRASCVRLYTHRYIYTCDCQARTFEWFKRLKDGWESVEYHKYSGRQSTCTTPEMIAKVRDVILEERRQTIHYVCNRVGLSYGSCQRILADEMNIRRIAAKFALRHLSNEQWDGRVQVWAELQGAVRHDPNSLSWVITGDESRLYDYDPETKQQYSQWKTPSFLRLKEGRQIHSNKSILIVFLTFEELCIRSLFHLVEKVGSSAVGPYSALKPYGLLYSWPLKEFLHSSLEALHAKWREQPQLAKEGTIDGI
jgi:hypothetical protein